MKKLFYAAAIIAGLFTAGAAQAQVSISVNIGSQPSWGPAGYDYARYYYIPEYNMYYDVPARCYVYYDNGGWIRRASLPRRYRHYDFYRAHKVVINDRTPWHHHDRYRSRYGGYRGRQVSIRDNHHGGSGYSFASERSVRREHSWGESRRYDSRNGHGRGYNQGHGNGHGRGNGHGGRHRD
ncbi:hypothetical protein [Sphingobacterium siyangense]|uniref:hypothetical protein n=1 Tax=Sphingobacterium siyangense TaxID=459529 RepID=UPI0019629530|nr:hypothetical protein [Sphingobacterium siyangense]QRY56665.1 hypothetical protein JVX97_22020 [Sphingobacterium siyangense]